MKMTRDRYMKKGSKWAKVETIEEREISQSEKDMIVKNKFNGDRYEYRSLGSADVYRIHSYAPSKTEKIVYTFKG